MSREVQMPLAIDDIAIGDSHRAVNTAAVKRLADSIDKIGLRHPITVREKGDQYLLVAGRHRMEAFRKLGRDFVPACIVKMTNDDARLWEISENLHRSELSKLERDENIAEWIKITERVSPQVASKPQGGRPEGGVRAAARELGIDEDDARRALKVADLSEDAKAAAIAIGLDNNRSALLEAARQSTPSAQVAKLTDHKPTRVDGDVKSRAAREVAEVISEYIPGAAWDAVKANLYAAGASNIANALTNITGQSLMDRRYS